MSKKWQICGLLALLTSVQPSGTVTPATQNPSGGFQEKRGIAAFSKSISFYGRVIDQDGKPVSDAEVKIATNDKPSGGRPSEYLRKTDGTGFFSIEGIRGLTLAIEVSRLGYRPIPPADNKVTSSGVFEYGLSSIRGPHRPDKSAPVLFTLYRRGQPQTLLKVGEKNFRIARDGSPFSISLDQSVSHQIVIRCWNSDQTRPQTQRQYDWRLELTIPNGGLEKRPGLFDFTAPEGGYSSSDTIDMPASLPPNDWRGIAERSYFIRFRDGVFARANMEMHAAGDHFLTWESFLNPTPENRNLEGE